MKLVERIESQFPENNLTPELIASLCLGEIDKGEFYRLATAGYGNEKSHSSGKKEGTLKKRRSVGSLRKTGSGNRYR